jgi:hypothetical protein
VFYELLLRSCFAVMKQNVFSQVSGHRCAKGFCVKLIKCSENIRDVTECIQYRRNNLSYGGLTMERHFKEISHRSIIIIRISNDDFIFKRHYSSALATLEATWVWCLLCNSFKECYWKKKTTVLDRTEASVSRQCTAIYCTYDERHGRPQRNTC